jgi:hypothetical protein
MHQITYAFLLTMSSTTRNAHTSPLLRLPAELRNQIYAYVIQDGTYRFRTPIVDIDWGLLHMSDYAVHEEMYIEEPRPRWAGLLRTSYQINAETRLLPYSLNGFSVRSVEQLQVFIGRFSGSARDITLIRLELAIPFCINSMSCNLANAFPRLERADLRFEIKGSVDLICWFDLGYADHNVPDDQKWKKHKENIRQWLLHSSNSKFEVVLS